MSLFYERGEYQDDGSYGWERAVVQHLEPAWGILSLRISSGQPLRPNIFHVRDRLRLQSFMSSTLLYAEDNKKLQSKIFLSC
ncbi:hypothetical protein GJAV_G00109100 [Gymnothorax javanicus]|nr:hypothetical protein GJAV_G00109100 [Gymnothorax javanicus]